MTSLDATLDAAAAAPTRNHLLDAAEWPPVLLVFGLAAAALVWNLFVGLRFTVALPLIVAGPAACFALFVFYRVWRPEPKIAETALYVGLWLFYPAFGAELTYLATQTNYPLQDNNFVALDQAMGFDWLGWARFVLAHPWFKLIGDAAYSSCFWQPLAAILIFVRLGPKGRNGEFLTSVMLGLFATIAVYMALPSIGPADMRGIGATGGIVESLRRGFLGPYTYVGIVPFPSFHTVMAILFTLAFRGHPRLFAAFGLLNLLMLSAVPFQGDHYLCDMVAGAVIATGAFFAARWLYRAGPAGGYNPRKG